MAGRHFGRLVAGLVLGMGALALAGEGLLRLSPPADLLPYLGAESPLAGPYAPDPLLGATYRSFDAFREIYGPRLDELERERAGRPVWAMFGNSFVQAPGMLGDTARAALPGTQIFYLRRNEQLHMRVAQFRLLLEAGFRPRRAFFTVLPIDIYGVAVEPVVSLEVTPRGGLGRKVRAPAWGAPVLARSRMALAAWVRSGRQDMLPGFRPRDAMEPLPPLVGEELARLFGAIAEAGARHGVPVTIVSIPNREQIYGDPRRAPQDAVAAAARAAGLDLVDVAPAFAAAADKPGLFIPDGHFSDAGNAVLLDAILAHVGEPAT